MTTAPLTSTAPATAGAAGRPTTPTGPLAALTNRALLDIIDNHRRERRDQIHALIATGSATAAVVQRAPNESSDDLALGYATAHHVLEGAYRAAEAGDTTSFQWYRETPQKSVVPASPTSTGSTIILNPPADDLLRSPAISDTAYYLINAASQRADAVDHEHCTEAITLADQHGFGTLLGGGAKVICLLARRGLLDTLHSWTISALPGTIFTDHTGHPEILARDLVHEAGHNWLNDALAATATRIPDLAVYSPWRRAPRPAFGFLHACWAFPLTVLYTEAAVARAPGPVQDFLTRYLETQRPLIRAAHGGFTHIAKDVENEDVRSALTTVFEGALDLG